MQEKRKSNVGLIISLVIAILIIIALGIFIFFNVYAVRFDSKKEKTEVVIKDEVDNNTVEEEATKEESTTEATSSSKFRSCTGTYVGNVAISENIQTKQKEYGEAKIVLNEDSTFNFTKSNGGEFGYYVIVDNSLVLLGLKHTTGPKDQDPAYTSLGSFVMSDDCSKIYSASSDLFFNTETVFNKQ